MDNIKEILIDCFHAGRRFENGSHPQQTFEEWYDSNNIAAKLMMEDKPKNDILHYPTPVYHKTDVSDALPMYDVDELNEIVKLYNNGEIDLYTLIGRAWNKAYFIGANEGTKAGLWGVGQ